MEIKNILDIINNDFDEKIRKDEPQFIFNYFNNLFIFLNEIKVYILNNNEPPYYICDLGYWNDDIVNIYFNQYIDNNLFDFAAWCKKTQKAILDLSTNLINYISTYGDFN